MLIRNSGSFIQILYLLTNGSNSGISSKSTKEPSPKKNRENKIGKDAIMKAKNVPSLWKNDTLVESDAE